MAEKKKRGRPFRFTKPLANEIITYVAEHGLMEYGGMKQKDLCAHFGIVPTTLRDWCVRFQWFKDEIDKAKEIFKCNLSHDAVSTLVTAAKGYYKEEEDTTTRYRPGDDGSPQVAEMVTTKRKRYIKPDVAAAIFLVSNLDPEHFTNRQRNDIIVRNNNDEKMTLDEINAEIERLEKID